MVSLTLSIPEDVKEQMNRFSEINWSGFVKKCITEKVERLTWKEEMLKKFKVEEDSGLIDWSVELGRNAKAESFKKLLSKLSKKERDKLGL